MLSRSFLLLFNFWGILILFELFENAINTNILLTLRLWSFGSLFSRLLNLFLFLQNCLLACIYNINQRQDNLSCCIGHSMIDYWNRSISDRLQHHFIVMTLACTYSQKWLNFSTFIGPIVTNWAHITERSPSEFVGVLRLPALTFIPGHTARKLQIFSLLKILFERSHRLSSGNRNRKFHLGPGFTRINFYLTA